MTALDFAPIFRGRPIPPWLLSFEADSDEALANLLLGRASLEHLSAEEPSELLLDWLERMAEYTPFRHEVDAALSRWIQRSWGRPILPGAAGSASVVALAWQRVTELLAFDRELIGAARTLRHFFPGDRAFLNSLSEGRSRDPEGMAWFALSRYQENPSLLDSWWRLCRLDPEVPWYHGAYGIHGLRGLPHTAPRAFPGEVASGLARLADGLASRVSEGWLDPKPAREEFLRVARMTMDAFPGRERWVEFWRQTLGGKSLLQDAARGWIEELFPRELEAIRERTMPRKGKGLTLSPDPEWIERRTHIREQLRRQDWSALPAARQVLAEQAHYADQTGDGYFVSRTACNFAKALIDERPEVALEWTDLAGRYDPSNEYAWTTRTTALLQLQRLPEALKAAISAVQRFPDNVVARTSLAEVLKAQGRLDEAEAVYRETIELVPDNAVARTSLAEVLKAQGRLDEAEALYRETVRRFEDDFVAWTGLGGVLLEGNRLDEAERAFQTALSLKPGNPFALGGLTKVRRAREGWRPGEHGYYDEDIPWPTTPRVSQPSLVAEEPAQPYGAEGDREVGEDLRPMDVDFLLHDVFLLRRWARSNPEAAGDTPGALRERARRALRGLVVGGERDARLASELGLWRLDQGELDEGLALLRQAARRFPGSVRVRYALARAEREAARRRGTLDPDRPEAAALPWRQLSRLDARLLPLHLLGEGRTWLAQTDGAFVAEKARACLGELGYWIAGQTARKPAEEESGEKSSFFPWWAEQVGRHLFGATPVARAEDLPPLPILEARIEASWQPLNRLEEGWIGYWGRA